jgi:hypothetical protein
MTQAAGQDNSDAAVATALLPAGDGTARVYGDCAYGTGDLRAALGGAGHTAVIKPWPLRPAVEGGFTLDDFTADENAATVTCPAGLTRRITARRNVTFGAACRGCPLRARCTANKHGRALILHPHDALLRAARHDWATQPGLREDYRKYRPNVERVISQVASHGGRRLKLRYRGTTRNNAWLKNRTAALNLRNLLARGLTRHNGTWALARPAGQQARRPAGSMRLPLPACQAGHRREQQPRRRPARPALQPRIRPCRRSSRPRIPLNSGPS